MSTGTEPQRPTPPSPATYATRAADALRKLNEATDRDGGYQNAPVLYATLSPLSVATTSAAKALQDATAWLQAEHSAGRVASDDQDVPVAAAIEALQAAAAAAAALVPLLDQASARASHLARAVPHGDAS